MNYESARLRRKSVDDQKCIANMNTQLCAIEDERDLYREILLDCVAFLPDIDPHGVDKRAVEEALGKDGRRDIP